jgi:hypothetical protein
MSIAPRLILTQTAQQRFFHRWAGSQSSKLLHSLKTNPGISHYLAHDPKYTAMLRARLRHNRARTNTLLSKFGLADSANCSVCNEPDTIEHLLEHCPRFDSARFTCTNSLASIHSTLSLDTPTILDADSIPKNFRRRALRVTGEFLLAVNRIHKL